MPELSIGQQILQIIVNLIPLVVVILLGVIVWKIRLLYINVKYMSNMEWVMLEIRVPREIHKSPQAMELVLDAMYQTYPGHWYDVYIKGIVRNWFSLEIISIEGKIYFLMYIPKFYEDLIKSQIYSQYPRVEVNEVPDYTRMIPSYQRGGKFDLFGYEFGTKKHYSWPIKTYVDYKLDRDIGTLEDIEKIDPLAPLLEFIGSIGPGEQIWIQILLRASTENWKKAGANLIKQIKEPYEAKEGIFPERMTKEIQDKLTAIDRKTTKVGFDCGIRGLYIADKDSFSISNRVALRGVLNAFGSQSINSFRRPLNTNLEWPWKKIMKFRVAWRKKRLFKAYQQRAFFYFPYSIYFWPFTPKPFVLNSEEIATVYHFPGMVTETPTFKRIEFKKAEPPTDLPF